MLGEKRTPVNVLNREEGQGSYKKNKHEVFEEKCHELWLSFKKNKRNENRNKNKLKINKRRRESRQKRKAQGLPVDLEKRKHTIWNI